MDTSSKIYVAGHRGLVGSALVRKLEDLGYSNLLLRTSSQLDLRNQSAVEKFFYSEKPDYVFLSAAKVGGISANHHYRGEFIYENLMIQNNVIHHSYLNGVKKLLFLGSTCIYPRQAPQPMTEDSLLTSPLEYTNEPYAITKIAGTKLCESYNLEYGTNYISVMPTNLYGQRDNYDLEKSHVLPALIRKCYLAKLLCEDNWKAILKNLNLPDQTRARQILNRFNITKDLVEVWGTGQPRREFLHSDDMADACVYLMSKVDFKSLSKDLQEVRNTHINIGTGKDISIKEVAYLIKDIVGYQGDFNFNTEKPDGTMLKRTDTTKLNSLGWSPKIELRKGIEMVVRKYRSC